MPAGGLFCEEGYPVANSPGRTGACRRRLSLFEGRPSDPFHRQGTGSCCQRKCWTTQVTQLGCIGIGRYGMVLKALCRVPAWDWARQLHFTSHPRSFASAPPLITQLPSFSRRPRPVSCVSASAQESTPHTYLPCFASIHFCALVGRPPTVFAHSRWTRASPFPLLLDKNLTVSALAGRGLGRFSSRWPRIQPTLSTAAGQGPNLFCSLDENPPVSVPPSLFAVASRRLASRDRASFSQECRCIKFPTSQASRKPTGFLSSYQAASQSAKARR